MPVIFTLQWRQTVSVSSKQGKEEMIHKLLRSSQKLIHVGHPEGEPLHDKVMELKLEFKQFKKRMNERKENLKKHLSFCEQGKQVALTGFFFCISDVNGQIWLTMFFCVATQFPSSDYSHGWIPLFSLGEEYIRTKVTKHANDEYELFTHVHTSKCIVTFVLRYAAAS